MRNQSLCLRLGGARRVCYINKVCVCCGRLVHVGRHKTGGTCLAANIKAKKKTVTELFRYSLFYLEFLCCLSQKKRSVIVAAWPPLLLVGGQAALFAVVISPHPHCDAGCKEGHHHRHPHIFLPFSFLNLLKLRVLQLPIDFVSLTTFLYLLPIPIVVSLSLISTFSSANTFVLLSLSLLYLSNTFLMLSLFSFLPF